MTDESHAPGVGAGRRALGETSPNPMVGAVLVRKGGFWARDGITPRGWAARGD